MNIDQLEDQIRNMHLDSKANMIVTTDTVESFHQIHGTAKFRHIKTVVPFSEGPAQNYFLFRYRMHDRPLITITVKSPAVPEYKAEPSKVWKTEKFAARVLTSLDISETFNSYQPRVMYGRDIELHESNMSTHKLIIELLDERLHTVVQMNHERDTILYLN